jgi:hypothetical protein
VIPRRIGAAVVVLFVFALGVLVGRHSVIYQIQSQVTAINAELAKLDLLCVSR